MQFYIIPSRVKNNTNNKVKILIYINSILLI